MKKLMIGAALLFCVGVYATEKPATQGKRHQRKPANVQVECGETIEAIIGQIRVQPDCQGASQVVETCYTNSDTDVQLVKSAIAVCEKSSFPKKMPGGDAILRAEMNRRCKKQFIAKGGVNSPSVNAFCQLAATRYFDHLYREN